jgi:hypothetical protein
MNSQLQNYKIILIFFMQKNEMEHYFRDLRLAAMLKQIWVLHSLNRNFRVLLTRGFCSNCPILFRGGAFYGNRLKNYRVRIEHVVLCSNIKSAPLLSVEDFNLFCQKAIEISS